MRGAPAADHSLDYDNDNDNDNDQKDGRGTKGIRYPAHLTNWCTAAG
jgi:hypothetical protein